MAARRPRSLLKKILLTFSAILVALLILVGTLGWWLVMHPEDAWALAQRYLLPADLKVTWAEMHFKPEKITWLSWKMDWSVKGLNVQKGEPLIQAPVDEMALQFTLSLFRPATHAEFARVLLHATQPIRFLPSADQSGTPPEQSPYQRASGYLHYLELGNTYATMHSFDVDIEHVEILSANATTAPLVLSARAIKPGAPESLSSVKIDLDVAATAFKLNFTGQVDATQIGANANFASGKVLFEGFHVKDETDFTLSFVDAAIRLNAQGPMTYTRNASVYKFKPDLALSLESDHAGLQIKSGVEGLPAPMPKLNQFDLRASIPLENNRNWSAEPGTFSLNGPLQLFFVDPTTRKALTDSCQCEIPEQIGIVLNGKFWGKVIAEKPRFERPVAEMRLSVDNVKNRLFSVALAADLNVFRDDANYSFKPKLDSEVHIYSYRSLRKILDNRNVLIPSPFDVLEGTIDITAKSPVGQEDQRAQIPIEIKTKLASEHQKVDLTSNVKLDLDPAFKGLDVYAQLIINAFDVQLPPLDPIAGMPKITRDSRIQLTPPKPVEVAKAAAATGFKVQMFFEAKTATPGAIKLLSQYAKPNVPFTLEIRRAMDKALTGSVELEPFSIQYLRRVVRVEHMRMLMDVKDQGDFPVDGRLRVDQTQYKVFIDLSGTLRKPIIQFSSDPYLEKKDIISVLLYDRVADDASDSETAGSFESAVADRAIGLFGIWAFASTPIRSFSYNPVTKVYAATVQLADGLTAGIGTDWEEAAHLEVRKRVSKRWVLTASWAPSDSDKGQVGKLVLQWEKRF